MKKIEELLCGIPVPRMVQIRQKYDASSLSSVETAVRCQLSRPEIRQTIRPGMRVAITAGSRGIRHYPQIIQTIVEQVRKWGAYPFVIPAMGSHGGATSLGQLELLRSLGITEDTIGAPIQSSMETICLGKTDRNVSVWFSKDAYEADATILVGRIKPHTAFHGAVESGVIKMGVVGCGKQRGAEEFHALGIEHMAANIVEMGKVMLAKSNVVFGLAILENAYDETFHVEAMPNEEILQREPELLQLAKKHFPQIMFPAYDMLIVENIGKNISGDGADPNITGRFYAPNIPNFPQVQRLVYLDLTEESHGNAIGLGVADFITKKLFEKIDLESMYINTLTNCVVPPAKIPVIMDTAELAIKAGIRTLLHTDRSVPKIIQIQDTLHLNEIYISESLLPQAKENSQIEIISPPLPMRFNTAGELLPYL